MNHVACHGQITVLSSGSGRNASDQTHENWLPGLLCRKHSTLLLGFLNAAHQYGGSILTASS